MIYLDVTNLCFIYLVFYSEQILHWDTVLEKVYISHRRTEITPAITQKFKTKASIHLFIGKNKKVDIYNTTIL
jgi:hypothetical protein